MTSINRAKTTIEELKKLFSKGRKPSEEDFARLIDTLNDEIDSELFYTKEEVNKLMECVKSENLEEVFPLIETIEEEIELEKMPEAICRRLSGANRDFLQKIGEHILKFVNFFQNQ